VHRTRCKSYRNIICLCLGRHTLCQDCLASFIRTSVVSATYSSSIVKPLTCFESDCSTELNAALLQAFVSLDIYDNYRRSMIERRLFSSGRFRQCPSRACSNLLIVNDSNQPSLMCSCGQRVCAQCLSEYHFPATCQQYKNYLKRLTESGDHLLSLMSTGGVNACYVAQGKNCPKCGEFVEKNGGKRERELITSSSINLCHFRLSAHDLQMWLRILLVVFATVGQSSICQLWNGGRSDS
jgi:hypothetical protein